MSSLLILRALLFAGECFLATLLLPLLAFALTAGLRRRAALRHLVWTTMFGVLAVLPIAALLLPARQLVQHAAAPVAVAPVLADVPAIAAPVMAAPPPELPGGDLLTAGNIILLLVALWLAGLVFQALRLGLGGIGLARLRRRSAPFAVELETRCEVRLARDESGPSTFGILRPVVLLPRSAADWPAARLEAVLRHEAAHVARRDTLSQLVARLVCALWWPNPLLWLAARQLRREAEIAADDAVLAGGMTPSLYATELVRLAAEGRGTAPGIAMAGPPLTKRVEAVLAENSSRKGVSRMDIARTVTFGLAATLLLGAARFDLAVAQDAPAPPARRALPAPQVNVDVKPRVELNRQVRLTVEPRDDVQRAIEAQAAAVKAQADINVAHARAQAAAETDPRTKEIFRRNAEEKAAEAAVTKANADLAVAQAREAARREAQARQQVDGARRSDSEFQRGAMAMSETALARTQEALARQAQAQARAKADPGKQQLMQLMADSVAMARQEMAQARARADNDTQRAREIAERYDSSREGVQISVRLNGNVASGKILGAPQTRQTLDEAIKTAVAEARNKINAAIARANAEVGASGKAGEDSNLDLGLEYVPDRMAPMPLPPAPPSGRAIPAPPAPPAPPRPLN